MLVHFIHNLIAQRTYKEFLDLDIYVEKIDSTWQIIDSKSISIYKNELAQNFPPIKKPRSA